MADENTQETNTQQNTAPTAPDTTQAPSIDYDKIESMISKGAQQKESAILKSYFEQQGMTEDEIKQAVSTYKADRAKKAEDDKTAYATMQAENEKLKAQVLQNAINMKASDVALDMGVDKNAAGYLVKMADMSKVVNGKGEIEEDAIKEAFDQVLKDVPALKASQNSNTGFKVGADNVQIENDHIAMMRKAAGLK